MRSRAKRRKHLEGNAIVVRELITVLGARVQPEGFKQYEQAFDRIKQFAIRAVALIGVTELGKKIIESAAAFEQERLALTGLLGSAQKATEVLETMTKMARHSIFSREDLVGYTKQFLTFGFSLNEISDLMEKFGNIAVVVGKDRMPMIAEAFARVRETGKADARVFREFFSAGIDLQSQVAKAIFHTTELTAGQKEQFQSMIRSQGIAYKYLYDALTTLTTGTGQYANLSNQWSRSLTGQWIGVQRVFHEIGETLGGSLLPVIKEVLGAFKVFLDSHKGDIAEGFKRFLGAIAYALGFIYGIIYKIVSLLGLIPKSEGEKAKGTVGPLALAEATPGATPEQIIAARARQEILMLTPEGQAAQAREFHPSLDVMGRYAAGELANLLHRGGMRGHIFNYYNTIHLNVPAGTPAQQARALYDLTEMHFRTFQEQQIRHISSQPGMTPSGSPH